MTVVNFLWYCRPLSMSENLTKLAHKIDFSKDESEEKGKPTSEGDKDDEEEESAAAIQPALWPWDSVWNKLKYAFRVMLLGMLNGNRFTSFRFCNVKPVAKF